MFKMFFGLIVTDQGYTHIPKDRPAPARLFYGLNMMDNRVYSKG